MPIPDYETLMLPVLRLFDEGAEKVSDCIPKIKKQFDITDEEAEELIPSGRMTLLGNRTHWARTYLSKAGLLESPKRNRHVITEDGRRLLRRNPPRIDNSMLEEFEGFRAWRTRSRSTNGEGTAVSLPTAPDNLQTPEDAMGGKRHPQRRSAG